MKRYLMIGIAVVAILGVAGTMALVSNTAMADNAVNDAAQVELVVDDGVAGETAVTQNPIANPSGDNFVDEDGDGICDTCDNVPGTGTGEQNGNGAAGDNFVDLDGDGVCDDCEPLAPADGTGNQYGRQGGQGGQGAAVHQNTTQLDGVTGQSGNGAAGDNFVDLDGDGICDDCAPLAPADGTGNQYGRQGGQGGQGQGQRGGGRGNN
jgi:hypothetical protein